MTKDKAPALPSWLLTCGLAGLVFAAYLPVWRADYIWDDDAYVTKNPTIQEPSGIGRVWLLKTTPQYYPLVFSTFWLEYRLWGLWPAGYHATNLLLHAGAAILLWRVLVRLELPGAWLAAALFALHPVQVESVAWITERKNVLSACFYFAALGAYMHYRPLRSEGKDFFPVRGPAAYYFLGLALFIAALLSKTVACSLPATILLLIYWRNGRIQGRDVLELAPWFAAGLALAAVTVWVEKNHVGASGEEFSLSWAERLLVAGRAVWFYAGKLVWPYPLAFMYQRWQIDPGDAWQYLYPLAAAVVPVSLFLLRHHLGRGPLVAVLIYGGTLVPALGFISVYPMRYTFVADHFQYSATPAMFALFASVSIVGLRRIVPPTLPQAARVGLAACLAAALLAVLGWRTWVQTYIYRDVETLWRDTIVKSPDCWMAYMNLGVLCHQQHRIPEAESLLMSALALDPPRLHDLYLDLGALMTTKGDHAQAVEYLTKALAMVPDDAAAHHNLSVVLLSLGRLDDAERHSREASRLLPRYEAALHIQGNIHFLRNEIQEAERCYRAALEANPRYAESRTNLGAALMAQARYAEAERELNESLRIRPDNSQTHFNLANVLEQMRRPQEAIAHYREALRLAPNDEQARAALSRLTGGP